MTLGVAVQLFKIEYKGSIFPIKGQIRSSRLKTINLGEWVSKMECVFHAKPVSCTNSAQAERGSLNATTMMGCDRMQILR